MNAAQQMAVQWTCTKPIFNSHLQIFQSLNSVFVCRADVSKLKFEGKTFYVIGIQKEVSEVSLKG